jgi:signal transduction histidine kinase
MLNEELSVQMELTSSQNIELEMVNNIKNKLFSIISHDLRSPIATLQTLFSVYREGDIKKNELKHLLTVIEDSVLSTGTFLDNLLEWSKSQMEGIVVQPVNFDVNEAIAENINLFDVKIGLKDLKVSNLSHQPVLVNADRNMINLVIRNLLSNSIKFCNAGDEITFDVQPAAEVVIISITDTGPGISERDSEKLFSLEHTVSTGTHGEKGNRLGLVLVKDMLLQNNGNIRFETQTGKGTTFWIELPAGKAYLLVTTPTSVLEETKESKK